MYTVVPCTPDTWCRLDKQLAKSKRQARTQDTVNSGPTTNQRPLKNDTEPGGLKGRSVWDPSRTPQAPQPPARSAAWVPERSVPHAEGFRGHTHTKTTHRKDTPKAPHSIHHTVACHTNSPTCHAETIHILCVTDTAAKTVDSSARSDNQNTIKWYKRHTFSPPPRSRESCQHNPRSRQVKA